MNKRITALLLALMMVVSAAAMTACGGKTSSKGMIEEEYLADEMDPDYENDSDFDKPKYDSEGDGAEVVKEDHDVADFIGLWDATSHRSEYMYGNVYLNIEEGGTWKGNITEEDFQGKWKYGNGEIVIKDDEGIIDFTLFYNSDGYLMFKNNEVPEDAFVLEKHKS